MSEIKLILSGENSKEPRVILIDEDAPIREIIIKESCIQGAKEEEIVILLEDDATPCDPTHPIKHHFRHHDHIHCHRCGEVTVDFSYNNKVKSAKVPPSATGAKLIGLLPNLFGISEKDADGLRLEVSPEVFLAKTDHIGRFVSYPHCQISISLVPNVKVQG